MEKEIEFSALIKQYLSDDIGKQLWPAMTAADDAEAMRIIFLEGACFDFANTLSCLTNWPVYEIQWGSAMPDDPDECDTSPGSDYGIHRVVKHPSGRYLDASGWTDIKAVLARVNRSDATYQWMGEVDSDGGVFDVDFEMVEKAVIALLPQDVELPPQKSKMRP